jgi:serine/threonine protein kinase
LTASTGQDETVDGVRPLLAPEGVGPHTWAPVRVGELVGGKYRISRLVAEGGMGLVYEAQHTIVKRRFAVKFLRPDLADKRESLGRFQREAEAAGSLENEHIASVVDFGITPEGSAFIVMEFLVGESLAVLLKREGPLPVERATDLCIQACHGAGTAHAAGIVHRDLKPHNLFVCKRDDGTDLLKILDFGIAKLAEIRHEHASIQTGSLLGTPAYMSPEQARGEKTIDQRSDVYSLGAILFQLLSGELPHPGDSPNAVLFHISTEPAVSLATVAPDLPKALATLVDSALASAPDARPQSAKAFAAELARFSKREAWSKAEAASERKPRGWSRAVVGTALIAAGVGALLLFGRMGDTKSKPAGATIANGRSGNAEMVPTLARTLSMSTPSSRQPPVVVPAADVQPQVPGRARPPSQSRAPAYASGSSSRRSDTGATDFPSEPRGAAPPAEGSPTHRPTFPRPNFDPDNPYRKPER